MRKYVIAQSKFKTSFWLIYGMQLCDHDTPELSPGGKRRHGMYEKANKQPCHKIA